MIDLQQHKLQEIDYPNQLLLMDFSGKIVESCNSIFDTYMYQSKSIVEDIPFLESIFHIVKTHLPGSPDILFKKVEKPFYLLQGIYDFTFSTVNIDNQLLILWKILDKTSYYDRLTKNQQRRNESEIRRQLRNSKFSVLKMKVSEYQKQLFDLLNVLFFPQYLSI